MENKLDTIIVLLQEQNKLLNQLIKSKDVGVSSAPMEKKMSVKDEIATALEKARSDMLKKMNNIPGFPEGNIIP